jgi:hypothetical protein
LGEVLDNFWCFLVYKTFWYNTVGWYTLRRLYVSKHRIEQNQVSCVTSMQDHHTKEESMKTRQNANVWRVQNYILAYWKNRTNLLINYQSLLYKCLIKFATSFISYTRSSASLIFKVQ